MGGLGDFMGEVNPIFRNTLGEHGLDIFGKNAKEDAKKEEKRLAAESSAEAARQAKLNAPSPDGPTADVNKDLLDKQNRSRRSFLLNRSTGRSPQGPQIEPIQQNRSLF